LILPGICLLAGAGICPLASRLNIALVFALVMLVGAGDLLKYYREFDHPHIDEAAQYVRIHSAPGEQIYVGNAFRVFSYYFKGQYPRIGSDEWDEFGQQFRNLHEQTMDGVVLFGNSRSSEKLPSFIHFIAGETDRRLRNGQAPPPFWLVLTGEKEIFSSINEQAAYSFAGEAHFKGVSIFHVVPAS
jgi:hypothetical protein